MADYGLADAIAAAKAAKTDSSPVPPDQPFQVEAVLPLEQILGRPGGNSRPLNPEHVSELADSIAAVGLIQPIAVDRHGHLLAGGHRRAALQLLQAEQVDRFAEMFGDGVPVRAMDIDADQETDKAIAIEAAENEKRRDYTPAEVRTLADRLIEQGYSPRKGRPKKGQKALSPALAVIIGKSTRTVERYLQKPAKKKPTRVGVSRETQLKRLVELLEWFELDDRTDETAAALAAKLREQLQ